jgi:hypothetical protein
MRLPPVSNPKVALEIMTKKLTENVPYNAVVTIYRQDGGSGWCMKELKPNLMKAITKAG